MSEIENRIRGAAQTIGRFYEDMNRIAGAIKAKVEALTVQAKSPQAHQPEDLSDELAELDNAVSRLAGVGSALGAIAERGGGQGGPVITGVTPIGDIAPPTSPARGTGPEGGVAAQPGSVPTQPNAAAPGAAVSPTGSHDLGPGGGGPAVPPPGSGFQTTLTGEPPTGTAGRAFIQPNMGAAKDAPIASPGQGGVTPQQTFPQGQQSGVGAGGDSKAAPVTGGPGGGDAPAEQSTATQESDGGAYPSGNVGPQT